MTRFSERRQMIEAASRQMAATARTRVKMAGGVDVGGAAGGGINMLATTGSSRRRYEMFSGWVFVCIRAVASRVAGQPIHVGFLKGAAPNQRVPMQGRVKAFSGQPSMRHATPMDRRGMPKSFKGVTQRGQYDLEIFQQHAILDMLDKPNPVQDKHAFIMQTLINYFLTGMNYWVFGMSEGKPEIWAVPTHWITPHHDGGLFTSYTLKVSDMAEPVELEKELVGRYYLPDPTDLKTAVAPARTQMKAITTDEHIQTTQENMFENGLFPSIALKVGKNIGPDGRPMDTRPVLTATQRRAIATGIKKVWAGTANYGDPAIIDGLIEGIERLQTTPREMDFTKSGEITKKRIFQAFGVNPITVGEITAANRAQAVEAEKSIACGTVNPLIDGLSTVLTNMLGPLFDATTRTLIWIEEYEPIDPDVELRRWTEARKYNDVTTDEFRAHVLGLGPMAEDEDDSDAGDDEPPPDDDIGEDIDEDVDEGDGDTGGDEAGKSVKSIKAPALSRTGIAQLHTQQASRLEGEVTRVLAKFFR